MPHAVDADRDPGQLDEQHRVVHLVGIDDRHQDTGERYLSTFLFEGINEGSDDEWLAEFEAGKA